MKWLSFSRLIEECDGQGLPFCVPNAINKTWVEYAVLWLVYSIEADLIIAFVTLARLCKIYWDTLGSHNWFLCVYKTGKLSRVGGLDARIRKLADGTKENNDGTEAIFLIHHKELAARGMTFKENAKVAWFYKLKKIMDSFRNL